MLDPVQVRTGFELIRPVSLACLGSLLLAACGEASAPSTGTYTLPAGSQVALDIPSDTPLMVSFGFELGSPSWDAADNCPERKMSEDFDMSMPICGELRQRVSEGEFGSHVAGQYGAGISFEPADGFIRLILINHARQQMTYEIEVSDLDD